MPTSKSTQNLRETFCEGFLGFISRLFFLSLTKHTHTNLQHIYGGNNTIHFLAYA